MKTTLFLIVFGSIFMTNSGISQDRINFDMKIGSNWSWGNGNKEASGAKPNIGYGLGFGANMNILYNMGIELDAIYSYNRANYSFYAVHHIIDGWGQWKGLLGIHYFDVPLTVNYNIDRLNLKKIRLGIVKSWAMGVNAKGKFNGVDEEGDNVEEKYEEDPDDAFRNTDFALILGTSIKITNSLGLDINYHHGIKNLLVDLRGEDNKVNYKVKRSFIEIMLVKKLAI